MTRPADLTPNQWEAVNHIDGPLLVLAGPGSGKTRVITRRIARMIECGVDPRQILAITFTNKASREMASRVEALLPGERVWVSTFHRFCAVMLRRRAEAVGLRPNFTIYDTSDQQSLIRRALNELNLDAVHCPPGRIASRISRAKNAMQTAEQFEARFQEIVGHHIEAVVAKVYPLYQQKLLEANAVDFDDLLLHMVTLLHENEELRSEWDERFRYVLVDEYQDTNLAQYNIVAALSHDYPNLCVTGDPDQSIYGWRGARIENILRFEAEFPDATVVRLEQNFRSTPQILAAADTLIAKNERRKQKSLVTDNRDGTPVQLLRYADGRQEAAHLAESIREAVDSGERTWGDFAIMYRVNALSREVEHALRRQRIPYVVAAGVAFYERAEIKDMLAYLRLIHNPQDEAAFRRVVNTPRRGIGAKTQAKIFAWARLQNIPLIDACAAAAEISDIPKRTAKPLAKFGKMMQDLANLSDGPVAPLLGSVIDRTEYTAGWLDSESEEDQQRLANVQELLTAAQQFDRSLGDETSLEAFLDEASLVNDVDSIDEETGAVTLLTLHAAKGLEFPVVFVLAVEQNLIPHERSLNTGDVNEYEEERRLLFVGMTRAMHELYLTHTKVREFRGRPLYSVPSDFLYDLNLDTVDHTAEFASTESRQSFDASDGEDATPTDKTDSTGRARELHKSAGRPLLTTAADLLNGASKPAEIPQGFAVGMTVRHPQYGLGTVAQVSGFGSRRSLTVEFHDENLTKTFVQSKCPLQPVGSR